jgi:cell division protein FtsQ
MKRIKTIASWVILLGYLLLSLSFTAIRRYEAPCVKVDVVITDSLRNRFISKTDVYTLLSNKKQKCLGLPLGKINSQTIENVVTSFSPVGGASVYKTVDGHIVIEVSQREPIIRIINNRDESFYIDKNAMLMPLSGKFTSHVLIANGNIKQQVNAKRPLKVANDSTRSLLSDLYNLAVFINSHKFWHSQIEQIYVNADQDIELIPLVGAHVIVLGDGSDLEEKFNKLEILYTEGFPYTGWNAYETINLKFKNQIVCTKR